MITGLAVSAGVILADQAAKIAARTALMEGIPEEVFGNLVRFTLRFNTGAAFSLGWGGPVFLSVFTAIACVFLIRIMRRAGTMGRTVCLGIILGGAMGNLVDRILMGRVTDFIDVGATGWRWPTFNVADIAICIGGIAVFFLFRKSGRLEASSEEKE
jgi:signal peptidase II